MTKLQTPPATDYDSVDWFAVTDEMIDEIRSEESWLAWMTRMDYAEQQAAAAMAEASADRAAERRQAEESLHAACEDDGDGCPW